MAYIEHCVDDDTKILYHLNGTDGSSDKLKDEAGVITGTNLTEANNPTSTTGFRNDTDGAYNFVSSSNQYLETSGSFDLGIGSGNFSVGIFVKTSSNDAMTIINHRDSNDGFEIRKNATTNDITFFTLDSGTADSLVGSAKIADGNWHYIECVRDNTKKYIYVDGSLDNSKNVTPLDISFTGKMYIGVFYNTSSNYFNGDIDEVTISKRAKTSDEISKYYNGTMTAKYYAGNGRGAISKDNVSVWSDCRNATTGDSLYTSTTAVVPRSDKQTNYYITRLFLPINTQNIPSGIQITNAKVYHHTGSSIDNNDSISSVLVETNQDDNNSLALSDYNNLIFTSLGEIQFSSMSTNSWYYIELNDFSKINTTGYTNLGIITSLDLDNTAPTGNNRLLDSYVGGDYIPYILIEYTLSTNVDVDIINNTLDILYPVISYGVNINIDTINNNLELLNPEIVFSQTVEVDTIDEQLNVNNPSIHAWHKTPNNSTNWTKVSNNTTNWTKI